MLRNHLWRPLFLALILVLFFVAARSLFVPNDFGIHERGYMYGWHRKANEQEWQAVPVKYKGADYCRECHGEKDKEIADSLHTGIGCENCHGPALNHPHDPATMTIDRSRSLCIRCHSRLPYPTSRRARIRGIDPKTHYPEAECVMCHYPHNPRPHRQRK